MGLKRKRSSCTLSPSSVSSRDSSVAGPQEAASPTSFSGFGYTFGDEDTSMEGVESGFDMSNVFATSYTPQDLGSYEGDARLHSRTRKRFRDNRPEESAIYESTISKLFLAQRPNHEPAIPAPRPSSMSSTSSRSHQQTSLHSFWAIPTRPTTSHNNSAMRLPCDFRRETRKKCEDCDNWVENESGMDVDMDMGDLGDDASCRQCGKVVCGTCAVVDVGAGRECLGCKTRSRRWVGGIGWVS